MEETVVPPAHGLAGLQNIGNTCYANSVLQATRAIPLWSQLMDRAEPSPDADETSRKVFLAYQDIIRTLWSTQAVRGAVCRPMAFWKEFRESVVDTVYESFRQAIPHDAHEFLIYLLDQCHEALKVRAPDHPELYGQLGGWTSPVVEQLFGWDRVECRCEDCGHKSVRYEPFNMLKVGITEGAAGLVELVKHERKPETLDDYVCETCSPTRTKATIRRTLHRLPKTLFYVLRRFTHDGRKDNSTITYDGAPVDFDELFEPGTRATLSQYRPIATIDHMGSHMGGHYIAQIYHPLLHKWFIFDDEQSHPIGATPHFGPMTYIIVLSAEAETEAAA